MKRILVIQLCRMGDILQTTPMLRGLRRRYPDAEITLMLHDLFAHVPVPGALYDRLVAFPYTAIAQALADARSEWATQVVSLRAFVGALGPEPFDMTLNLTHSDLAGLLAAGVPSREVRGGLVASDRTRVVQGSVMSYFWASQTSRELGCFNLVDLHNWTAGVVPDGAGLEIAIPDTVRAGMREWFDQRGLTGRPLIAVQLGASDERKRWPPERFAEAVSLIPEALGEILLVGAAVEGPLAARVLAHVRRPVHDTTGNSLVEVAALLERCRVLLTNDTGTMHVATAVGTPVIDISTGPVFAHETGPYGEGNFVIEPVMDCFPCAAGARCSHLDCRDLIVPQDVAALVCHALDAGQLPRPAGARILTGRFTRTGRLEYRPVWSPVPAPREVVRQAAAEVWETTLAPGPCEASSSPHSACADAGDAEVPHSLEQERAMVGGAVEADVFESVRASLTTLATRADAAAGLARQLGLASPAEQEQMTAAISRELDAIRVLGEVEPACQPIAAYLKVRLDSIVDRRVDHLAIYYSQECAVAARRARRLAGALEAPRNPAFGRAAPPSAIHIAS
jgi:ADP-heptose:LPS heptosyltransferase